jgi:Xaa-Pro aminopeptidase
MDRTMKNVPFAEIPYEEYRDRLAKIHGLMEQEGIEALLLFDDKNVYYYSGYRRTVDTVKVEGILIPKNHPPIMLMPQLTSRYCEKAVWIEDIRPYSGADHLHYPKTVVDLAIRILQELGLDQAVIGLEMGGEIYPHITFGEIERIMAAFPRNRFIDASKVIWAQRKIKSAFEQDIMRRVARIALNGFNAGLAALKGDMTEAELSRILWRSWMDQGIADTPMEGQLLIRTGFREEGPNGRYPCSHARPTDYPIRRGETVLLDAGPCYRGYFADLMRQACIGPPSDILRELFDTAVAGYQRGIELLKPGVRISDLTQQAIDAMKRYNPRISYPLSFVGHSLGLTIHEPPWFSTNEGSLLEPGMVINFEIGAYDIPEWRTLGGFLEDMFLITEDGNENVTPEGTMTLLVKE